MGSRIKEMLLTWATPIGLVTVLVVLGVLQYRWSREVSDAASTRMQVSLQSALMNFRTDLAREFATACLDLQLDKDVGPDNPKRLADRFDRWRRTSAHPNLIANVYLWDSSRYEDLLFHVTRTQERFELLPWPSRLDRLHTRLAELEREMPPQSSRDHHPQTPLHDGTRAVSASPMHDEWPVPGAIDETLPMLIVPAVRTDGDERGNSRSLLLVELDRDVLDKTVLGQLADRYFGEPATSEYEVAVTTDAPKPQVLYSSEMDFGSTAAPADAVLNLFGPFGAPGRPNRMPPQGLGPWFGSPAGPSQHPYHGGDSHPMFGELIRFDPIIYEAGQPCWQVVARNRQGSVAAAVAGLRRRNLAVGFGVLVVLAATMGLILFTSQRARRLATLQMDFVAGVSHELRTPIAAILSAAENIADGVVESKQQVVRYGTMIRNQARQLNHLVEQVLRFAVTQKKAPSYIGRPIAVSDAIHDAMENMAPLIRDAGFEVDLEIAPNLPLVTGDPELLFQCLQNLVTNAVKYGRDNKWIGIRASAVPGGRPEKVSITVEDRGIGIDAQELKQIFEPFYRSPSVVASSVHGTGLGLTLAKTFVETMGGVLTVQSEKGKGASFTVHLPVANQAASAQNVPDSVPARQRLS